MYPRKNALSIGNVFPELIHYLIELITNFGVFLDLGLEGVEERGINQRAHLDGSSTTRSAGESHRVKSE
jgi:hypothetical protein